MTTQSARQSWRIIWDVRFLPPGYTACIEGEKQPITGPAVIEGPPRCEPAEEMP